MTVDRDARLARAFRALRASPSFRGLPEPSLQRLARVASHTAVTKGEQLELEPDGNPCLYLVAAGDVGASTPTDAEGISEFVGHEGPGSVFGSAAITGEEEVPTYHAAGEVEAYVWKLADLEELFEENADLATRLSVQRRRDELVDLLRQTALFRQARQSLLRRLVGSATLTSFDPGSVICREGDEAEAMFLIVSGEVAISQEDLVDPLQQLHRGDFFGEIALIQNKPRMASAIALSRCEVLVIGKTSFDALYRRSSSFRGAARTTAETRLAANVAPRADPELVWLVNDTSFPADRLAALLVDALREVVGEVAPPVALDRVGEATNASLVVCYSDATVEQELGRRIAEQADSVVFFTEYAEASFPYETDALHGIHHVILDGDGSTFRRDAFRLSLDNETQKPTLQRLARAVSHRRVGVALGGGAAWGYAHVVLLRGLERAQIPVDMLVGVSVGSIVGAFYASQGLNGLERLVDAKLELSAAALAAIGTTSAVDLFMRRHIPETRIEELSLPFATVAVEARTGREKVFRHGPLSAAVRASCSLPGVFGRPLFGGDRYLDAGVRHNVPVGYCAEADADFVIACDVVPPPRASRDMQPGLKAFVLDLLQVNRVTDTVRSLYWLASDSGRQHASLADSLFSPDLSEFFPWDFHRADAIIDRAEQQVEDWLAATRSRYEAL